jgi:hypothetical protein
MNDEGALQARGRIGMLVLILPILSIVTTGAAYAIAMWYGVAGRPAQGPLVRIDLDGCAEAEPLVRARVEQMGLPEVVFAPRPGGFSVTARLPDDPRTHASIPTTLAATGTFEVRPIVGDDDGAEVIVSRADVEFTSTYMAFLDAPKVLVQLKREPARALQQHMGAHPNDRLGYWVDGRRVTVRNNLPPESRGQITLDLGAATDIDRMDFAAAAGIVLEHGPLPCALTVASVTRLDAPAE